MTSEPKASISRLSSPAAWSGSSLRSELLHTSSAKRPVLWAGVGRTGRISWSTTGTPRSASCKAHSEPGETAADDVDRTLHGARQYTARSAPPPAASGLTPFRGGR